MDVEVLRRYPATVDDIRRRVFESSRSEKHADVVNLTSSRSELASSFRTGNISSIWVQFQDIPVGKSIQFKFHDLPELGEKLEPEKGPINGEEQELENELKYSWWMLYHVSITPSLVTGGRSVIDSSVAPIVFFFLSLLLLLLLLPAVSSLVNEVSGSVLAGLKKFLGLPECPTVSHHLNIPY
ncbi:hypothetical protein LWI28_007619 [Acer negundo]|uniref:Uncharacterized protein n=1 Tax=Acer negundo TaxID=4023 RepID=A0AAD5NN58_ACENE|nr:hypothetical protein LWI28_007619 [Acer negundo]